MDEHEPAFGDWRIPGPGGGRDAWRGPISPMRRPRPRSSGRTRASSRRRTRLSSKTVADYEKASGNKIDLSVMPFMALSQKAISALTSGDVPDLIFHDAPSTILPQNAWDDKLVDVSDVVETHKSKMSESALLNSSFYNSVTKQRSFYLVPIKQARHPFHIWGDLVEKAGFKMSDMPKTWDDFWDFFKPVQNELRKKGCARSTASACRSPPSDRTTATTCSRIS